MNILSQEVNPESEASEWPSWSDDYIELGVEPTDDDAAWWAAHAPGNNEDAPAGSVRDERDRLAMGLNWMALDGSGPGGNPAGLKIAIDRSRCCGIRVAR